MIRLASATPKQPSAILVTVVVRRPRRPATPQRRTNGVNAKIMNGLRLGTRSLESRRARGSGRCGVRVVAAHAGWYCPALEVAQNRQVGRNSAISARICAIRSRRADAVAAGGHPRSRSSAGSNGCSVDRSAPDRHSDAARRNRSATDFLAERAATSGARTRRMMPT